MPRSEDLKDRLDELFSGELPEIKPIRTHLPKNGDSEAYQAVIKQESIDGFHAAFNLVGVGMCSTDTKGCFEQVNITFADMLGYKQVELVGKYFQDITYPEDHAIGGDALRAMLIGDMKHARIEKRYVHKDGHLIWVSLDVNALPAVDGSVERFITIVNDISQQKNAAILLEKKIDQLRCLNDLGHRIDENPTLEELFEWLCRRVPKAMHHTELCLAAVEYHDNIYGDVAALELPNKIVGGLRVDHELEGWLHIAYKEGLTFEDDESALMGAIVSRLNGFIERQAQNEKTEQALKQAFVFQKGIEQSTDSIFITDIQGNIIYINPAFEAVYGYSRSEVIGENPRIIKSGLIPKEGYQAFWQQLLNKEVVSGEIINKTKDGRLIPIEGSNVPILDDKDNILGFLAVHRDISDRKRTEEELNQRSAALEAINDAMEKINQTLDMSEIFHEMLMQALSNSGYKIGLISLFDQVEGRLNLIEHEKLPEAMLKHLTEVGFENTPCELVYELRRIVYASDIDRLDKDLSEWGHIFEGPKRFGFKSYFGIPFISKGQVIGTLCLFSDVVTDVNDFQLDVLQAISQQVSIGYDRAMQYKAIEKALSETQALQEKMAQRAAELATVADVSTAAATILNTNDLLQSVVDLTTERFGLYHAHIYLLDANEASLILSASAGKIGRKMVEEGWEISIESERSLVARCARTLQGVIVNDVRSDPGFLPNEYLPDTAAEMAVPLIAGDEILGVLDVQSDRINHFTEQDVTIQTTLAYQVAVALQNARHYERTELALRQSRDSEGLVRTIIESTPDWIFIKDRDHRFVLANPSFADSLGFTPEEMLGKNDLELGFPEEMVMGNPEKGIKGYWWDDQEILDSGEEVFIEGEINRIDDETHFFDVFKAPLRDQGDEVIGILGIVRDVTARKEIEEKLKQRAKAVEAINRAMELLNKTINLDELFSEVLDQAMVQSGFDVGLISLVDQAQGALQLIRHRQLPEAMHQKLTDHGFSNTPCELVFQLGEFVNVENIYDIPSALGQWSNVFDGPKNFGFKSYFGIPFVRNNEVVGTLCMFGYVERSMTDIQLEVLNSLSQQVSIGYDRVIQFEQTQEALAESTALYEGSAKLVEAKDIQGVLTALSESVAFNMLDLADILLFDKDWLENPNNAVLAAQWSRRDETHRCGVGTLFDIDGIGFVHSLAQDHITIVHNVMRDVKKLENIEEFLADDVESLLVFPLVSGGQWFGVLIGQSKVTLNLREAELRQIDALVDQSATVIQSIRLRQNMSERVHELTMLQKMMSRDAWLDYRGDKRHDLLGYTYNHVTVQPIEEIGKSDNGQNSNILGGDGFHSMLDVRGEPIGVLGIKQENELLLSEDDVAFLRAVSEQVAQAMERARLIEQTHKAAVELQAVADVSTATSTILNPNDLLQSVVDLTKNNFGLYHAHAYLLDQQGKNLILTAGAGDVGRSMVAEGWSIPVNAMDSVVAKAAQTSSGQVVDDVRDQVGYLPNPLLPNTLSELAVPMVVGDKLLGVFDVQAETINRFTAEDVRTYMTLASQSAVALQNAKLYEEQLETVERLRELDNMKSAFLANMSHELRTPLNSILGFTQVILEGLDGPLTDMMLSDLGLIEKNGKHLLRLINDVLDMAKIEAGRFTLSPEPVNLYDLMEEVIISNSALARERNLYIHLEAEPSELWTVSADQVRLRQIFINLIGNSIKFTDIGGITIELERFWSANDGSDDKVQVRIKDTGIGIPKDKLEAIFEAFSQVDSSTTRKAGGTGLGLPISRKLVELHGGSLWAESSGIQGEGSVFYLELPIVNDADLE